MFDTTIDHVTYNTAGSGSLLKLLLLVAIETTALIGNLFFVTVVFFRKPITKQTRTFIYLGFVSITNLGAAIFVIPFPIITLAAKKWVLTPSICYFNGIMNSFWLTLCIFSMTLLSLHKYFTIVRPIQQRQETNYRHVCYKVLVTTILSIIITLIPFMGNRVYFNPYTAQCAVKVDSIGYVTYVVLTTYVVPTFINVLAYSRILMALKKHQRRLEFTTFYSPAIIRAQKEIIKTLYLAFMLFVCSWTPFFVYAILLVLQHESTSSKYFLVIAYMAGFSNSALNSLLFIFRNLRIRSWRSLKNKKMPRLSLTPSFSHSQYDERRTSFFDGMQRHSTYSSERVLGHKNYGYSSEYSIDSTQLDGIFKQSLNEDMSNDISQNNIQNTTPYPQTIASSSMNTEQEAIEITFCSVLEMNLSKKARDYLKRGSQDLISELFVSF